MISFLFLNYHASYNHTTARHGTPNTSGIINNISNVYHKIYCFSIVCDNHRCCGFLSYHKVTYKYSTFLMSHINSPIHKPNDFCWKQSRLNDMVSLVKDNRSKSNSNSFNQLCCSVRIYVLHWKRTKCLSSALFCSRFISVQHASSITGQFDKIHPWQSLIGGPVLGVLSGDRRSISDEVKDRSVW